MKIKASKQRNFTTSTMTSSANYDAEIAEELAAKTQTRNKSVSKVRNNFGSKEI